MNKVPGKRACSMKNYLEQNKEELIVDLLSTCCAIICLVALIISFKAMENIKYLPAAERTC